jgi:hypothetical protein
MNLDGRVMYVSSTAEQGVIGAGTRLRFSQKGARVLGRYDGGAVVRGYLVGRLEGSRLVFRYAQVEASTEVHRGSSVCDVLSRPDGRVRIHERLVWHTRPGYGTNVLDEIAVAGANEAA